MIIDKHQRGFTLIETIIYIALFSVLIGGGLVTVYELIDGSGKLSAKNTVQEEGNFVLRKLNWALTGVSGITSPSSGTPLSNTLSVNKYDGNRINVELNGTKIEIEESDNGNTFTPITTDNIKVSSLEFEYLPSQGEAPVGVKATIVIDGYDFSITKYLRQ